jgi:hypothetical protein
MRERRVLIIIAALLVFGAFGYFVAIALASRISSG